MSGPRHIDLDNPGDCALYAELYERTNRELVEMSRLARLRGEEVARLAFELGMAKGQRDREARRASFYKSCALSGEVPSVATIEKMDTVPE